jgi:hypothetical protein
MDGNETSASGSRRRCALAAALVLGCAVAVYANTLSNGFVLDDEALIVTNPQVRSLAKLHVLFGSDYWEAHVQVGLHRPLVVSTFALDYAAGGLDARVFHGVNVALHALVSLPVFGLIRALALDPAIATATGLLFAVHAVHTEAVANVAGRAELLASLFFLLALHGHLLRERAERRRAPLCAASLCAYALALLSKENAVTLIGVILLYDMLYVDRRDEPIGRRVARLLARRFTRVYAGYLLVTLLYLATRYLALRDGTLFPPVSPFDDPLVVLPLPSRLLNAL